MRTPCSRHCSRTLVARLQIQDSELDPARLVLVHRPSEETFIGPLHPSGFLFEANANIHEAQENAGSWTAGVAARLGRRVNSPVPIATLRALCREIWGVSFYSCFLVCNRACVRMWYSCDDEPVAVLSLRSARRAVARESLHLFFIPLGVSFF